MIDKFMDTNFPLVTTTWLFENASNPALIILDASLNKPVKNEPMIETKLIPASIIFDWDKFSNQDNQLPHMMPTVEKFTQSAQELGINNNSLIVVYDCAGIYSSPRVWWMFLVMGFKNCYVLNGGLPAWLKMGYNYTNAYAKPNKKGDFVARYNSNLISDQEQVFKALSDQDKYVIDARNEGRFYGKTDEPRAGLRKGHMPNALNIPFEEVLFKNEMCDKERLEKIFESVKNKNNMLIFSCGSGITACINALAATILGYQNISIYDGSWSEWGGDLTCPIA